MMSEEDHGSSSPEEKPQHYTYLKEFRTQQCAAFLQHKCTQHRPFTCFNYHFLNQRRRRPFRKKDGTMNYSADIYCPNYDETTGICTNTADGNECPYLHRNTGDTERRYHLRYYKTSSCVYETDSKGQCSKNGAHCAFAHGPQDLRAPVCDIRDLQKADDGSAHPFADLESLERDLLANEDPKWSDSTYVLAHYKTELCQKPPRLCRQGYACPQYHNSKDRRRSPKQHKYRSTPCPDVKRADEWCESTQCEKADACPYCHTRTEQQFHPEIYKSTKCNDMAQTGYCPRGPFCAFAHVDNEIGQKRDVMFSPSVSGGKSGKQHDNNNSNSSNVGGCRVGDSGMIAARSIRLGSTGSRSQPSRVSFDDEPPQHRAMRLGSVGSNVNAVLPARYGHHSGCLDEISVARKLSLNSNLPQQHPASSTSPLSHLISPRQQGVGTALVSPQVPFHPAPLTLPLALPALEPASINRDKLLDFLTRGVSDPRDAATPLGRQSASLPKQSEFEAAFQASASFEEAATLWQPTRKWSVSSADAPLYRRQSSSSATGGVPPPGLSSSAFDIFAQPTEFDSGGAGGASGASSLSCSTPAAAAAALLSSPLMQGALVGGAAGSRVRARQESANSVNSNNGLALGTEAANYAPQSAFDPFPGMPAISDTPPPPAPAQYQLEMQKLRDEMRQMAIQHAHWEKVYEQARSACQAWEAESVESQRRMHQAIDERNHYQMQRDEALALLATQASGSNGSVVNPGVTSQLSTEELLAVRNRLRAQSDAVDVAIARRAAAQPPQQHQNGKTATTTGGSGKNGKHLNGVSQREH